MPEKLSSVLEALNELQNDNTVPRNVKNKVGAIIEILKDETTDVSIRINKVMQELEEITEDPNMQAYIRTQIWNVVSLLEMVH
ncbi:MAG TPA: UPF0147 family protein [Candidatus Nanoarchaeia archaeon]|nr:UPF0147 family protein [Candidatus Nanoarchaeia archaeon]